MREVRLRFSKTGRLKYISHLDINRAMSRALKRAGIPLWYTEGFNPHPYMSFSLPLSLGVESLCESVDLRITGEITNKEILINAFFIIVNLYMFCYSIIIYRFSICK